MLTRLPVDLKSGHLAHKLSGILHHIYLLTHCKDTGKLAWALHKDDTHKPNSVYQVVLCRMKRWRHMSGTTAGRTPLLQFDGKMTTPNRDRRRIVQ